MLPAEPGEGRPGATGSSFTRIKEKNRLAQQRFRAKQKNMVATLKRRLAELEDLVRWGLGFLAAGVRVEVLQLWYVTAHSMHNACRPYLQCIWAWWLQGSMLISQCDSM